MTDLSKASLGLAASDRKIVWLCAGWVLCSLLIFAAFAVFPGAANVGGLIVIAELLKIGAFIIATCLCWRNAKESAIISGQVVWQAIAVGLGFYALGDVVTLLWQLLWGEVTTAALAHVLQGISYIFLAIGLFNAVLPRQTSLSVLQTFGVATVGILGIVFASWVSFYTPTVGSSFQGEAEIRSVETADIATEAATGPVMDITETSRSQLPLLVQTIDTRLRPIANKMGLLYIAGDCILIVIAAALLVAFWGGVYSEAWKLIALAGLCLYVADMFRVYYWGQGSYRPGAFWEIFWILSALFFALGASVEYGVSAEMKKKRSRQQWI